MTGLEGHSCELGGWGGARGDSDCSVAVRLPETSQPVPPNAGLGSLLPNSFAGWAPIQLLKHQVWPWEAVSQGPGLRRRQLLLAL